MKFEHLDHTYLVRIERGEKVIETLTLFLKEEGITFGSVIATGALAQATLGYYDLENKTYLYHEFDEMMEVGSLTGNVAMKGSSPIIHVHAVLSKRDFQTVGGHLKEATVGATLEVIIRAVDARVDRVLDEEIGLALLQL